MSHGRNPPQSLWALVVAAMGGSDVIDVRQAWTLWRVGRPDLDNVSAAELELLPSAWSAARKVGVEDADGGRLDGLIRRSTVTGALATKQVERITAALRSDGVPVVLSGAAAARSYYPHPHLRDLRSVDTLATRTDLAAAGRLRGLTVKERVLGRRVVRTPNGLSSVLRWRLPGRLPLGKFMHDTTSVERVTAAEGADAAPVEGAWVGAVQGADAAPVQGAGATTVQGADAAPVQGAGATAAEGLAGAAAGSADAGENSGTGRADFERATTNKSTGVAVLNPTDAAVLTLVDVALLAAPGQHQSMMWAVDVHFLMSNPLFDSDRFADLLTHSGLAALLADHGRKWQGRLPDAITSPLLWHQEGSWAKSLGATQGHLVCGVRGGISAWQRLRRQRSGG